MVRRAGLPLALPLCSDERRPADAAEPLGVSEDAVKTRPSGATHCAAPVALEACWCIRPGCVPLLPVAVRSRRCERSRVDRTVVTGGLKASGYPMRFYPMRFSI